VEISSYPPVFLDFKGLIIFSISWVEAYIWIVSAKCVWCLEYIWIVSAKCVWCLEYIWIVSAKCVWCLEYIWIVSDKCVWCLECIWIVSAKYVWCLEYIFAVLLTFLHHLKPEIILLFITSLCYYIYHKSVVETALTAVLHHRIKGKRYSMDHDPWSCILNSICMKNRGL
jgi:hypothetical protein